MLDAIALDLHLLETVSPESGVGGDTVLTVVNEDPPVIEIIVSIALEIR